MLAGTFAEEIVRVLKFIILLVVKLDSAYQFNKFKFFNGNKQNQERIKGTEKASHILTIFHR